MKNIALWCRTDKDYIREMMRGIGEYSRGRKDWVLRGNLSGEAGLAACRRWGVNGVIVCWPDVPMEQLLALDVPTVLLQTYCVYGRKVTWVRAAPIRQAEILRYFLDRGFRNVAMTGESAEGPEHFQAEAQSMGLVASVLHDTAGAFTDHLTWESAAIGPVLEWLRRLPKPVGLFVPGSMLVARAIAEACRARRLRIPQDVAIITEGKDDVNCELCNPRISYTTNRWTAIGYRGARMLDEMLRDLRRHAPEPVEMECAELITRESSDVFAATDPQVIAALNFIRDHAHEPLTVARVAREIAVGQRTLQMRFKSDMQRTIMDVIHSCRTDRIKALLCSSDLPVKAISGMCGFAYPEKLTRFFKDHVGQTPTQYRQRYQR